LAVVRGQTQETAAGRAEEEPPQRHREELGGELDPGDTDPRVVLRAPVKAAQEAAGLVAGEFERLVGEGVVVPGLEIAARGVDHEREESERGVRDELGAVGDALPDARRRGLRCGAQGDDGRELVGAQEVVERLRVDARARDEDEAGRVRRGVGVRDGGIVVSGRGCGCWHSHMLAGGCVDPATLERSSLISDRTCCGDAGGVHPDGGL
jgi:hypothetical protein